MLHKYILGAVLTTMLLSVVPDGSAIELRNRIDPQISVMVAMNGPGGAYRYHYRVANSSRGVQSIWKWQLVVSNVRALAEAAPAGWSAIDVGPISLSDKKSVALIGWSALETQFIAPAAAHNGFIVSTSGSLPGIVEYYAEGFAPPPRPSPGLTIQSPLPGYDDVTPYGPGVVGRTVGPVGVLEPMVPAAFVEYLIELKDSAVDLGWIESGTFLRSFGATLESVKLTLLAQRQSIARNALTSLLKDLEDVQGKEVSGEAYGLLKFNLQYLIAAL